MEFFFIKRLASPAYSRTCVWVFRASGNRQIENDPAASGHPTRSISQLMHLYLCFMFYRRKPYVTVVALGRCHHMDPKKCTIPILFVWRGCCRRATSGDHGGMAGEEPPCGEGWGAPSSMHRYEAWAKAARGAASGEL